MFCVSMSAGQRLFLSQFPPSASPSLSPPLQHGNDMHTPYLWMPESQLRSSCLRGKLFMDWVISASHEKSYSGFLMQCQQQGLLAQETLHPGLADWRVENQEAANPSGSLISLSIRRSGCPCLLRLVDAYWQLQTEQLRLTRLLELFLNVPSFICFL